MAKKSTNLPPKNPEKWVAFRLGSLGDVVLVTGVLAYWHRVKGYTFTVVTKDVYACLFEGNPAVTGVVALTTEDLAWKHLLPKLCAVAEEHHHEGLLDLHGTLRTRVLALVWQGTIKRYWKLTLERRLFLWSRGNWFKASLQALNIPQRYSLALAVADNIPKPAELLPKIYLTPSEQAWAKQITSANTVILHPFATHATKAWPLEHWQALIGLLDQQNIPWLLLGQGEAGVFPETGNWINKTSLRETCAILQESACLITGDSGPMHLAEAVECPVIALFGPTSREWGFFPASERAKILQQDLKCRPCSLHGKAVCGNKNKCLQEISPQMVFKSLLELCA